MFVIGSNNQLYHKWQNTAGATTNWSPFASLGGVIAPNTDAAAIMNSDGRLEVFVVQNDNGFWHKWQIANGALLPAIKDPNLAVENFADGLTLPTSMAFIDNNNLLGLEKSGQVRLVLEGELQTEPILQLPVDIQSEIGLLGLAVKGSNVFLYYTESDGSELRNRVFKYTWNGQNLEDPVLVLDLPATLQKRST